MHPARHDLLLDGNELTVAEITQITGMPQSHMSTHPGKLREAGVMRDRPAGTSTYYALNAAAMPEQVQRLWNLVAETGDEALLRTYFPRDHREVLADPEVTPLAIDGSPVPGAKTRPSFGRSSGGFYFWARRSTSAWACFRAARRRASSSPCWPCASPTCWCWTADQPPRFGGHPRAGGCAQDLCRDGGVRLARPLVRERAGDAHGGNHQDGPRGFSGTYAAYLAKPAVLQRDGDHPIARRPLPLVCRAQCRRFR